MSFATYASQFLTRPQGASSSSSRDGTQPLFFSFTTDDASVHLDDVDDADDPHFRKYNSSQQTEPEDEEDPYLRLDDDDGEGDYAQTVSPQVDADRDGETDGVGWLAHQRSPSPPYAFSPQKTPRTSSPVPRGYSVNPPPPDPQSLSLALSESLLPRTGADAHTFNLPPPHSRRRRPQPNAYAAAAFLFTYTLLCVLSLLSLVLHNGGERPPPALLHTVPLVTFLTMLSAVLAYTHLAFLRAFLRPVLLVSALAPPLALFLSSVLAFAGSFSSGAGWGLRLFALVPLALAVLSVRRLPAELHRAARSPALLSLSTRILFFRAPLLMLLSPLILLAGLLAALPLLTLLVRLPLTHSWYAQLASAAVAICALHLSFVARAIQRSAVAGGVGAWYFGHTVPASNDTAINTGSPELDAQLRTLHAVLLRPLGPLVLSSLIALALSALNLLRLVLVYLPLALPYRFVVLFADLALARVGALGERIGGGRHTGVYCGLTGAGFWDGVKGVRALREGARERAPPALPLPRAYTLALPFALVAYLRAAGDREGEEGVSYAEQQRAAIAAAVLAGAVCAAVSVFCAGVVRDCADTLYVCHLIDRLAGRRPGTEGRDAERQEVWAAFDPSPDLTSPPLDAEAQAGFGPLNFGGFDFGRFGFFGGGGGVDAAAAGGERGGRGEEPVYARLRRTSEEANRKAPPPPPHRGRDTAPPRGFRAPTETGGFSALDLDMGRTPSTHTQTQTQVPRYNPQAPGVARSSLAASEHLAQSQAQAQSHYSQQRAVDMAASESDADSLDSRSDGGGESSGAFPGSGFFA
ncbi:hypothetical protein B0H16DRAFT_1886570 [Mycena metata]|uniref:Transmembrane protein n=1 Tax=Mycena metata TaxID=1033252 RepID=A0AAD7J0U9_9AGAR|nr:hypothetical protein B0H16DRAFT_1886570 [Mycena metata]